MLTDAKIRQARPQDRPYKLTDSHGLYVEVKPNGSKLWRYRYRIAGKENIYALGQYPVVSLSDARTERDNARQLVKRGVHPAHNRQNKKASQLANNANTFEAVAREWTEQNKNRWSPGYLKQILRFLELDAFPYIGQLPIRSIVAADLLAVVRRVEKRDATTIALLLRQWFSAIFRYAAATLRADTDPAAALRGAIQRPPVKHHQPLKDIPTFIKKIDEYGGYRTTQIALRLALLVFVRPGELRKAKWEEIDLDKALWRIPDFNTKKRRTHIVPLSKQAIKLLKELHTLTGGQAYLFPNCRRAKTCMTGTTLNRSLERMGYAGEFSAHGFRATASTMLNEMGTYRPDAIERQLAHMDKNSIRGIYNNAEYIAERREMMQQWADYLDGLVKSKAVVGNSRRSA